jgi:hypothetical protein
MAAGYTISWLAPPNGVTALEDRLIVDTVAAVVRLAKSELAEGVVSAKAAWLAEHALSALTARSGHPRRYGFLRSRLSRRGRRRLVNRRIDWAGVAARKVESSPHGREGRHEPPLS